jgi:hypothetical protein
MRLWMGSTMISGAGENAAGTMGPETGAER